MNLEHVGQAVTGAMKEIYDDEVVDVDFWLPVDDLVDDAYPHGLDLNVYAKDEKDCKNGFTVSAYANRLNKINGIYEADTSEGSIFTVEIKYENG